MATHHVQAGSTAPIVLVALRDAATAALKTGVTYTAITNKCQRSGSVTATTVTLVAGTPGAYVSGSWVETQVAGVYQYCPPAAQVAAGAGEVKCTFAAAGVIDQTEHVILTGQLGQVAVAEPRVSVVCPGAHRQGDTVRATIAIDLGPGPVAPDALPTAAVWEGGNDMALAVDVFPVVEGRYGVAFDLPNAWTGPTQLTLLVTAVVGGVARTAMAPVAIDRDAMIGGTVQAGSTAAAILVDIGTQAADELVGRRVALGVFGDERTIVASASAFGGAWTSITPDRDFVTPAVEGTPVVVLEAVGALAGSDRTKLDAIKTKTDALPPAPAGVGSPMTLAAGAVTAGSVAAGALNGKGDWHTAAQQTADFSAILTAISNVPGLVWAVSSRTLTSIAQLTGITSLANWLRAMARAGNNDPTAVSEINATTGTGTGTYDPATGSLQGQAAGGGGGSAVGPGADACTQTIQTPGGLPIADAHVWISTDAAGTNVIAGTLQTDSAGQVTFMLDAGVTYYLWAQKDGRNAIRGQAFVAVAD